MGMGLNNREISVLLWAITLISVFGLKSNIRESVLTLVRAFFHRTIILSLSGASIWIGACIWTLAWCGLWQWDNLKTTLIWTVTFAFVAMFDVNRISEDDTYFRRTVRDTIKATAIVTFIAELYSFSFFVELLLVPFLSIVVATQVIASKAQSAQYEMAEKLCTLVLTVVGIIYVSYGIYRAAADFDSFATWSNFREFIIPTLLSLLFLPFIFAFSVYVTYESNFLKLSSLDSSLHRYAKYQAIIGFRFNLSLLRRWAREIRLSQPSSHEDIKKSIAEIKKRMAHEQYPPTVPEDMGWSPYAAKDFLIPADLSTSDYHPSIDGRWFANSKMVELGSECIMPDNLTYYIEGDEHAAKRLKITLNVNNYTDPIASEKRFKDACAILLMAAVDDLPSTLCEQIKKGGTLDQVVSGRHICLRMDKFNGGYSRTLTIDQAPNYLGL